jgi:hypothetical protein
MRFSGSRVDLSVKLSFHVSSTNARAFRPVSGWSVSFRCVRSYGVSHVGLASEPPKADTTSSQPSECSGSPWDHIRTLQAPGESLAWNPGVCKARNTVIISSPVIVCSRECFSRDSRMLIRLCSIQWVPKLPDSRNLFGIIMVGLQGFQCQAQRTRYWVTDGGAADNRCQKNSRRTVVATWRLAQRRATKSPKARTRLPPFCARAINSATKSKNNWSSGHWLTMNFLRAS